MPPGNSRLLVCAGYGHLVPEEYKAIHERGSMTHLEGVRFLGVSWQVYNHVVTADMRQSIREVISEPAKKRITRTIKGRLVTLCRAGARPQIWMLPAPQAKKHLKKTFSMLREKYSRELGEPLRSESRETTETGERIWLSDGQEMDYFLRHTMNLQLKMMKDHVDLQLRSTEDQYNWRKAERIVSDEEETEDDDDDDDAPTAAPPPSSRMRRIHSRSLQVRRIIRLPEPANGVDAEDGQDGEQAICYQGCINNYPFVDFCHPAASAAFVKDSRKKSNPAKDYRPDQISLQLVRAVIGADFDLENGILRVMKDPFVEDEEPSFVLSGCVDDEEDLENIIGQYQAVGRHNPNAAFSMEFVYSEPHKEEQVAFEEIKDTVCCNTIGNESSSQSSEPSDSDDDEFSD